MNFAGGKRETRSLTIYSGTERPCDWKVVDERLLSSLKAQPSSSEAQEPYEAPTRSRSAASKTEVPDLESSTALYQGF